MHIFSFFTGIFRHISSVITKTRIFLHFKKIENTVLHEQPVSKITNDTVPSYFDIISKVSVDNSFSFINGNAKDEQKSYKWCDINKAMIINTPVIPEKLQDEFTNFEKDFYEKAQIQKPTNQSVIEPLQPIPLRKVIIIYFFTLLKMLWRPMTNPFISHLVKLEEIEKEKRRLPDIDTIRKSR